MSGPFRFNQASAQSPLERAASPFSAGQPVSYKTNVNRAKTKKWVEAKKNAYDGDDWGDYDEYDEYGVDDTPPPEPAPLSNPRYYGQRPSYDTPSRSFTDPAQQAPLRKVRKNSFDAGEEQRAFSASIPQPQQQSYAQQPRYEQPPPLQTSGLQSDTMASPQQTQDFSPNAVPQPLQTRSSTVPAEVHTSPSNTQFPPRKSSIGQGNAQPAPIDFIPIATSPRERAGSQSDKPLPFIRPADIYKRVDEERRRESIDSSRPSLDSLSSRPKDEPMSPVADRRNLQPLETVAERKSEYLPNLEVGQQPDDNSNNNPQRPQHDRVPSALKGIPTFDNDFWSSGPDLQSPASHASVVSPTEDQGFRSVVDQAFTRTDDQRSVPPTPISKDSDSDLNRSNTGSTSGISPIMSRVPSSATAALKMRNLGDGSTPVIAEEPHEAGTPVSRPTSGNYAHAPQATQSHARNISNTSLPRSGLATPTHGDSPARSPAFGPQKVFPEPEIAQIATDSSNSPDAMEGGLSGPHSSYATRESDIATAMLSSPGRAAPELSAAEKQSQDAFLESHNAQSPISDALPRDRSESPSKGRVQALAGKFGDVSHSRRGSTQSNISRNSVQSWERSRDNSRAASPTKGSPGKPSSPTKEFRPHLPGGWESYAITTPLERPEADRGLGMEKNTNQPALAHASQNDSARGQDPEKTFSALGDIDLTPTTAKRPVTEIDTPAPAPTFDPISALKDAGAAMTESLRTSVGLNGPSEPHEEQQDRRSHGDVYMPRPLHMERAASALSSIPPTPPAKDTPETEFPPTPPLKNHSPEPSARLERPSMAPQLSTDASADDQESDRLRKEIVASLSPLRMSIVPTTEPDHNSLRPDSKGADRASSILDSYYAELDRDSPRASDDLNRDIPELAPLKATSSAHSATPQKPAGLNHRYSWEADTPKPMTPDESAQTAVAQEPIKNVQDTKAISPTIDRAAEDEHQPWSEGLPENPYFGPGHIFTVTKPEPLTDAELAVRASTPPLDSGLSLTSPPTREQTRSPGLHIVNSAVDPEAVDLPPRWSAEHSPQPKESPKDSPPAQQLTEQEETNPAISADTALTGSIEAPESSAVHEPEIKSPSSPMSPTSGKPLGAREIATIGSSAERIATYNKTREIWATTDHGLSDWISATFEADPTLATQAAQPLPQPRPQSGTFRHKHTGSLAMLGKFTGSSNSQPASGAYYEQYNSAAAQVPASSSSPTAGPSKTSSGFLGRTASHSIQTQQMQAKGKDLLHTAGVLSGKGMISAKGLFAKGKSRFNRDKDPAHSREASREYEPAATVNTPDESPAQSSTHTDSPEGSKRRRRFSSPFRRSRSRPRSASAAFPSTTSLVSTTPLTTTPTDLPDVPKAFRDRPHSYHAPDLGMHPAYRGSADQLSPTSPSYQQGRVGILSSPTRTAFVSEREISNDVVPPVPPIPEGINERRGRRSRSWGNAGLMLQSAIRHATPAAVSSRSLGASPIITNFDVPEREVHEPHSRQVPWNDGGGEHPKSSSPRTRHSSPITKGLWMGDTSPVLSKRTPTRYSEHEDEEIRQPVLPVDTDGTPDLVQLSESQDESNEGPTEPSSGSNGNRSLDTTYHPLAKPSTQHAEEERHVPWPGTLLGLTKNNEPKASHIEVADEAPLPQEFVMQFSGEVSPLLRSSKASLQEVSDDEIGPSSPTDSWVNVKAIDIEDVSDDEQSGVAEHNPQKSDSVDTITDRKHDERLGDEVETYGVDHSLLGDPTVLRTYSPDSSSLRTIIKDNYGGPSSYDNKVIGIGDVSPTSSLEENGVGATPALSTSTEKLDIQAALESRIIGAGDVSPVSTRSSIFQVSDPVASRKDVDLDQTESGEKSSRPSVERFYTAGVGFDIEPTRTATLGSDQSGGVEERPRIERFETAQEDVQGSSELTVPKVRQPASRYATVMASEPVASYKEYTGSSSGSSDDLLEVMKPQATSGALTPRLAERADAAVPAATRRVSATQLQVVHAVEEYAASESSLASWDQDSNAADAISEPDEAVKMRDESDIVTPVAQAPRNAHHEQQADQAGYANNNVAQSAPHGYFNGHANSGPTHQTQQQLPSTSEMTVPERSKSLLSMISSAVSSTPISPASSNAGRSTPSTIHRMQRDVSNSNKTNLTSVQIPEEPTSAKDEQTPTPRNEDYDLYADHNGVVKDVRDANGRPLCVAPTPNIAPAKLAQSVEPRASSVATVPDDEPSRRYSFERPMSFVSGPQDDDGRPQDQINQPLAGAMGPPPIPPQSKRRSHQYQSAPSGAIYSSFEPMQDMHWPPGEMSSQPQAQPMQPPLDSGPKHDAQQANRFVPHKGEDPLIQADSQLPPQRILPALQPEMYVPNGQPPTNGHRQDQYNQNPRVVGNVQVQPTPRNVSAPQQVSIPGHGPGSRAVSQPLVSPPLGSPNSPRNEFEYQQQMMQLQAKYPRFRGAESQALKAQQNQQGPQQQEKPSSKPRIAAVLKGITGRTPPNASQPSNIPPAASSLAPGDRPTDASRAESFVSAVSSLSHEQAPSAHGGQPSVVAAPQRPPSLGAESHYSQVSHGSTQVQPAQSRQDLTVPAIPAPYQNSHPQQTLEPLSQSGASQGFRASTSAIPDAGKKKRFSAFTGLFNKGNTGVEQLQGKFKLSREERKAQKAQRHTSQPILQSQPTQQWPPPQQHFTSQQQDASHPMVQGLSSAVHPMQPRDPRFMPPLHPKDMPGMPPSQGLPEQFMQPQMQPQSQQAHPTQQQRPAVSTDEDSAYLRTKRLTEEHQAMQASQPPRPAYDNPSSGAPARPLSTEQPSQSGRRSFQKPPSNGYYYPDKGPLDQGAYRTSQDEQQRAQRLRQEQLEVEQRMRQEQSEAEQRLRTGLSHSPLEPGAYGASTASYQSAQQLQQHPPMERGAFGDAQAARQLAQQRREILGHEQGAYGATQNERQRMQQTHYPLPGPEAIGRSQIHYDQMQQQGPPQRTNILPQNGHHQMPPNRQQPLTREEHILQAEQELAQHRWQQQQHQLRQFHLQQQAQLAQQQAASSRTVSGPLLSQASPPASPVVQRRLSSHGEPQYDTPPIPGAYDHVQGVFVSPADQQQQHAFTTPQSQFRRQESDPQMQPISPQVSAPSQMPPNARHHSDASTVSVVSPISGPTPEPPAAGPAVDQRPQKPRMPSISEVHQQQPERPWHMNFPAGTTEQDIVRARQKQFFEQQFASQQQAQEQRHASSPSPRVSPDKQSPPFSAPLHQPQSQGGGFREVLPRTSPLPYAPPQSAPPDQSVQPSRHSNAPQSVQSAPLHPHEGAAWPLRTSPGPGNRMSPPNLTARPQIPFVEPQTPRGPGSFDQRPPHAQDTYDQRRFEPTPPNESQPPSHQHPYDEVLPDEAPPSYDGPGVPNEGMEKSHPESRRPPNIVTIPNERGRLQDTRPRQASLGLMQHPQPASMAASPQRTAADMGAESLRRQLLQQEEHARMERIQRTQMQRELREREQQEREAARARALELERSVSGGGRVGSLRSVRGSHNGGTPGWERRGLQGNNSRPVFELPALEDEEPVMRATSFPGQEWVPTMYDD